MERYGICQREISDDSHLSIAQTPGSAPRTPDETVERFSLLLFGSAGR
jgi:hypothetical protein